MNEPLEIRRERVDIQEDEIDLAQLWGILYSGRWIVAAFIVLALVAGAAYLAGATTTYRASALIQVTPAPTPLMFRGAADNQMALLMATHTRLITSSTVLERALSQLGPEGTSTSIGELRNRLDVSEQGSNTGLIKIALEGQNPQALVPIVNTVVDTYRHYVQTHNQRIVNTGGARPITAAQVRVINRADNPVVASAPRTTLVLALALVLGAMIGCGVVFLRAALRRTVDNPRDIEQAFGVPVDAVIPHVGRLARRPPHDQPVPLQARDYPDDVATEALRSLRTSLCSNHTATGNNVILLTAPAPDAGRNFVAANLGYLLAETGRQVAVIDADMRRGKLHSLLDAQRQPGLSEVLAGQAGIQDTLSPLDDTGCHIMPGGAVPSNPAELLTRERFQDILAQLRAEFDYVLVVAPPVLPVTDAAVIAGTIPDISTLLVVRSGQHRSEEIEETIKRITRSGGRITGVVFNGLKKSHADNAGGANYYLYEYKSQ